MGQSMSWLCGHYVSLAMSVVGASFAEGTVAPGDKPVRGS